jgi:hypothetical protein
MRIDPSSIRFRPLAVAAAKRARNFTTSQLKHDSTLRPEGQVAIVRVGTDVDDVFRHMAVLPGS